MLTDEQLWERLNELNEEENEIVKLIPLAYHVAHSWNEDSEEWRQTWHWILNRSAANKPVIDLVISHLTQRGDPNISEWHRQDVEIKCELGSKAQADVWRVFYG